MTNQISRGRSAVNIVKKRANNLKKEEEKNRLKEVSKDGGRRRAIVRKGVR